VRDLDAFYEALDQVTVASVFWKTQHRVPLSYVRDVSYGQNFLQAMFGVSSVTISPTNGNKIVLSNLNDGSATREAIWKLVLSESPN
jgi:hypothetical protein